MRSRDGTFRRLGLLVVAAGAAHGLGAGLAENLLGAGHLTYDGGKGFDSMRRQDLGVFAGRPGVAADIGFIGYFADGRICDLSGRVQGREFARLSTTDRMP